LTLCTDGSGISTCRLAGELHPFSWPSSTSNSCLSLVVLREDLKLNHPKYSTCNIKTLHQGLDRSVYTNRGNMSLTFEWIQENPNAPEDRIRRPRVVNACDYWSVFGIRSFRWKPDATSRLSRKKKVRCIRQFGQTECDLCTSAGKSCTYGDRDRYQAEREKRYASILGPSITRGSDSDSAGRPEMLPIAGPSTSTSSGSASPSFSLCRYPILSPPHRFVNANHLARAHADTKRRSRLRLFQCLRRQLHRRRIHIRQCYSILHKQISPIQDS
jgi:hypothetical protein